MIRFKADDLTFLRNLSDVPTYVEEGVYLHKQFIGKDKIDAINDELDQLFSKPCFNQVIDGSIWRSDGLKDISISTSIESINILELGIEIFEKMIPTEDQVHTIIANIHIHYERSSKNIPWHSDQLKNIKKFNIILKGGGHNSGEFQYIPKSHKINHTIKNEYSGEFEHHLNLSELAALKGYMKRFPGSPGDLLQFDPYGFHFRGPCVQERRCIFFEFQDIRDHYGKEIFFLPTQLLTENVVKYIHIFRRDEHCVYHKYFPSHNSVPLSFVRSVLKTYLGIKLSKIRTRLNSFLQSISARIRLM